MTAFTGSPVAASDYTAAIATPLVKKLASLHVNVVKFTQYAHAAGDGTGEINLGVLPAGQYTIFPHLSYLKTTQFGSSATISIGHRANVKADGTTLSASAAAIFSAAAAGSGAIAAAGTLAPVAIDCTSVLVIFATIASGNIEGTDGSDTVDLSVAFGRVE